jgi:3-hydroxy-9,10-secoandrosta-1,3,5(10)-triene-9,17-dione monooxygenase
VIAVPEPDLEPRALVERARALIPAVRGQQDEAERLGHHTAELNRQFTEAGFYRILQPRTTAAELARVHFALPDTLF